MARGLWNTTGNMNEFGTRICAARCGRYIDLGESENKMQSSVMNFSVTSSSIRPRAVVSSSNGPVDRPASCFTLGVRQLGRLPNAISLRGGKKSFPDRPGRKFERVRAERGDGGGLDEKLKDLSSEKAVEGMEGFDRSARLMVDDLKPVEHPGTSSPGDLELQAEEMASETDESSGGKDPVLEVASDSAVDPEHAHQNTVAVADELASELGRSVEDLTTSLEDRAEEASNRDAELLKTDKGSNEWDSGVGQVVDVSKESGVTSEEERDTKTEPGELTRDEATEKILDAAREGIEVLKWAAEGVMSAGANSREGFEIAKEVINKRVKSFNIAAEETKEVSAQLSDAAKKKYEEIQESAAKFSEELQVQREDKKASDELKPDSETNPLAQLSRGVQATIDVATKEDGPLAKLGQSLQENVAKLSSVGQDVDSKSQDVASKSSSQSTSEQAEQKAELVPVGEKAGFFQDLAPANGSSTELGDRSAEASDILGQDNASFEEGSKQGGSQEYEGFFGDIPVNRIASSSDSLGQDNAAFEEESKQRGSQEYEGFFGDIPVNRSASSSEGDSEQTPTISGDASATMKDDYEHEVGNDQLKAAEQSGGETSSTAAESEHDEASVQPSGKGKDEMGIGPDE